MIFLKTREEIELCRAAALMVSKTLGVIADKVKPGVLPIDLDKIAEEFIRDNGAVPAFKNYRGFPASLCISVNEVVVHGIPGKTPLKEGDIISVDCGTKMNGYYGDHAYTFCVGEVDQEVKNLVERTKRSLYLGIAKCGLPNRVEDISYAIQSYTESFGYGVVRELVGHGVGKNLHEKPDVPNFGRRGNGPKLKDGMVLAIEPMINMGTKNVVQSRDGWTISTTDKKPSAHFEHDVAIVDGRPEILSTYDYVYEALGINLKTADELADAIKFTTEN